MACLVWASAQHTVAAQQASPAPVAPQIIVSGSADVSVPPAKAAFSVAVVTAAPSAAAAGADNARISKGVLASIENAGVKRDEIMRTRLGVRPRWDYDEKGRHPRRTAFEAENTIQIVTDNLEQVGNFIDAALSAGATDVSEITFSAKDIGEARRRALGQAVMTARADAEAMARAAGGALGDVVLLSTERSNAEPGALQEIVVTGARRARESVATGVIPGQIKVTAQVVVRWKFVPAPAGK